MAFEAETCRKTQSVVSGNLPQLTEGIYAGGREPRRVCALKVQLQPSGAGDAGAKFEKTESTARSDQACQDPNDHRHAHRARQAKDVAGRAKDARADNFVDSRQRARCLDLPIRKMPDHTPKVRS